MSYRSKDTRADDLVWKDWLSRHAELLRQSGLPSIVLRDEDHWLDFLQHGFLDHHDDSGEFRLRQLAIRQKAALLRLLLISPNLLNTIVGQRITSDMVRAVEARYGSKE